MKSPKDGVIKEIRFSEGVTVNAGDVLVIIE
jgi:biotin carboxyl carrier protein